MAVMTRAAPFDQTLTVQYALWLGPCLVDQDPVANCNFRVWVHNCCVNRFTNHMQRVAVHLGHTGGGRQRHLIFIQLICKKWLPTQQLKKCWCGIGVDIRLGLILGSVPCHLCAFT